MTKKILFLLDMEWIRFGIAKFMKEQLDYDFYAIVDADSVATTFYKEQDLIKFQKIWYYRDYVNSNIKNEKIDIEYLKNFEQKYAINLWQVAYSERAFLRYNPYHHFTHTEILSILENECKLFEKILNEINPDYLIIKLTDTHQSHLLHQICKSKKIKILMMGPTRFAYHFAIHQEYDNLGSFTKNISSRNRSLVELQDYLKSFYTLDQTKKFASNLKISFRKKITKYINYIIKMSDSKYQTSYVDHGRTKIKLISQFIFIKRWYRKKFIDKNFQKFIDKNDKFIYYPLQSEPERTLLLGAPFYTNQLTLIERLAKSLPISMKLYVKEHGAMTILGWREISFYKKILQLPNVVLLHPSLNYAELIKSCSVLATIRGTSGIEAAFYDKPTIIFADVSFHELPSVYRITNMSDLPKIIKNIVNTRVDVSMLNKYVDHVEKNSFVLDLLELYTDLHNTFFNEFNYVNGHIKSEKMNNFFNKHNSKFKQLSLEHINKINET